MPSNPKVVVLSEQLRGQSFELTEDEYTMGRSENCSICIPDPTISGHHCTLVKLPEGGFKVVDNNSTNGTRVNGVKIQEQALQNSDIVQAGGIEMLYDSEEKTVTSMLSTQTGIRLDDSVGIKQVVPGVQNLSPFGSGAKLDEAERPTLKIALMVIFGVLILAVIAVLLILLARLF